jgi:hypothetical protein
MIRGLNPTAREAQYNDQQVEYYRKIVEWAWIPHTSQAFILDKRSLYSFLTHLHGKRADKAVVLS